MEKSVKGRGAQIRIDNRYSRTQTGDDYFEIEDEDSVRTSYTAVYPKTILNEVKSPDLPMDYSMNPYQGCEHGCVYCYARVTHDYWGYGPGLDFEQKILYKPNAPDLLRKAFDAKSWKPAAIMLSGNTDCYQPAEREFKITRKLLEVCNEYGNPVGILTKNSLLERDLDILAEMNERNLVKVAMSVTTLDESLRRLLEPRTSAAYRKLQTIHRLADLNIPVGIIIGPVIPGLTMHEIPAIMKAASEAGASSAGCTTLRLNGPLEGLFADWLGRHYPDRKSKVLVQVASVNGGRVGKKMATTGRIKSEGNFADIITQLMRTNRMKYFKDKMERHFNLEAFCRPSDQMRLFF